MKKSKSLIIPLFFIFINTIAFAQERSWDFTASTVTTENAQIIGINFGRYILPTNNRPAWGYLLRYDYITFNNYFTQNLFNENPNYDTYFYYSVLCGGELINHLFWKFYLVTPIFINFGFEELDNSSDDSNDVDNFFVGISGDIKIMFIPNRFGITFGGGLWGMYNTAVYYNKDIGFKLEAGLKF